MNLKDFPAILVLFSLTTISLWSRADGGAVLEIKVDMYSNAAGRVNGGGTCHWLGILQCSHYFIFSIDSADGSLSNARTGIYGSQQTGVFSHNNVDYFNSDMNGVANPIIQQFHTWPGSVLFKAYVQNSNAWPFGPDYVDSIISPLGLTPQGTQDTATWTKNYVMRGMRTANPTKLYCTANLYGPACAVSCVAVDDFSGHFTCDPNTGAPICLSGWKQDPTNKCLTNVDPCDSVQCQHGGSCSSVMGAYTCTCTPGFAGTFCEVSVELSCPAGYAGKSCDVRICDLFPCLNGGTCVNGACLCQLGFIGANCEQNNICVRRPCMNAGTCVTPQELYICNCLSGFQGDNCSTTVSPVPSPSFGQSAAQISVMATSTADYQLGQILIALIVLCCVFFVALVILIIVFCLWRRRVRRDQLKYGVLPKGSVSTVAGTVGGESSFESRRFRSVSSVSSCGDGTVSPDIAAHRHTAYPPIQPGASGTGSNSSLPMSPPGYDELAPGGYVMSSLSKMDEDSVANLKM